MARVSAFRYHSGATFLHRHDVRCKLVEMLLLTVVCAGSSSLAQTVINTGLALAVFRIRISLVSLVHSLRWVLLFLALIFLVRSLSTSGTPLVSWAGLAVTYEGVADGALICWRLTGILLLSLLFTVTTTPADIKAAIQWLLKPVPWVPERRVAVMISLMVRFIPVLLYQASETRDAIVARGIRESRNPMRRLRFSTLPLLRRTFLSADRLALALAARCYSDERTDPGFASTRADYLYLSVIVLVCGIAQFI